MECSAMHKHEVKNCPRCGEEFECKTGSISICQCQSVDLDECEADYVASRYDDCLCADCLTALRVEYNVDRHAARLQTILAMR